MPTPKLAHLEHHQLSVQQRLSSGADRVVQLLGPSAAGSTTLLRRLESSLPDEAGLTPIRLRVPQRAFDAGPRLMDSVASGLKSAGCLNGAWNDLSGGENRRVAWTDRLRLVRSALRDERAKDVVLLCDNPYLWAPNGSRKDDHFRHRAEQAIQSILGDGKTRVVFTGVDPFGLAVAGEQERISLPDVPDHAWLLEDGWGELAGAAERVASEVRDLRLSPLELRLLVAIVALGRDMPENLSSRIGIVQAVRNALTAPGDDAAYLRRSWRRLASSRRNIAPALLRDVCGDAPSRLAHEILTSCILFTDEQHGSYVLHELLRADAHELPRDGDELSPRDVHHILARYYVDVVRRDGNDPARVLDAEGEAFFHASRTGDAELLAQLAPSMADDLCMLGRTLAVEFGEHLRAADAYERAFRWEAGNAYAHHYFAYNLDFVGQSARTPDIEQHYQTAIGLDPANVWWHTRWITYQLTRGRTEAALDSWNEAREKLGLPDPYVDPWVYFNLHLHVIRLALHRGQLELAALVLRDVPPELVKSEWALRTVFRRLELLQEADRGHVVFPLSTAADDRWAAPHRAAERWDDKARAAWMAARVEAVGEDGVHLQVGERRDEADTPTFGTLKLDIDEYMEWNVTRKVGPAAGQFLELAWYEGRELPTLWLIDDGAVDPLINVDDDDPDPVRYLRASGWVEL